MQWKELPGCNFQWVIDYRTSRFSGILMLSWFEKSILSHRLSLNLREARTFKTKDCLSFGLWYPPTSLNFPMDPGCLTWATQHEWESEFPFCIVEVTWKGVGSSPSWQNTQVKAHKKVKKGFMEISSLFPAPAHPRSCAIHPVEPRNRRTGRDASGETGIPFPPHSKPVCSIHIFPASTDFFQIS